MSRNGCLSKGSLCSPNITSTRRLVLERTTHLPSVDEITLAMTQKRRRRILPAHWTGPQKVKLALTPLPIEVGFPKQATPECFSCCDKDTRSYHQNRKPLFETGIDRRDGGDYLPYWTRINVIKVQPALASSCHIMAQVTASQDRNITYVRLVPGLLIRDAGIPCQLARKYA